LNKVPIILGVLFLAVILLAIYLMGSAKRAREGKSSGGSHLGWALLFLSTGRVPPPPLETQIEAELNTKKDRSASDPLRKPFEARRETRGD
jgi:hypothetical protein